jgi:hypothetical protein
MEEKHKELKRQSNIYKKEKKNAFKQGTTWLQLQEQSAKH